LALKDTMGRLEGVKEFAAKFICFSSLTLCMMLLAYLHGITRGRDEGFKEGLKEGLKQSSKQVSQSHQKGHERGFREGMDEGLKQGHENAHEELHGEKLSILGAGVVMGAAICLGVAFG